MWILSGLNGADWALNISSLGVLLAQSWLIKINYASLKSETACI